MSTAAVSFFRGPTTAIHRHPTLMLHFGHEARENDTPATFESWGKESKLNRELMYQILAARFGRPARHRCRVCASKHILTGEQALSEASPTGLFERTT